MYGHPSFGQSLDRVIGAAGVGDDPVVGIYRRVCPPFGVRRLIQGDCVDGDLHSVAPSTPLVLRGPASVR
jgi:hypothetical protein